MPFPTLDLPLHPDSQPGDSHDIVSSSELNDTDHEKMRLKIENDRAAQMVQDAVECGFEPPPHLKISGSFFELGRYRYLDEVWTFIHSSTGSEDKSNVATTNARARNTSCTSMGKDKEQENFISLHTETINSPINTPRGRVRRNTSPAPRAARSPARRAATSPAPRAAPRAVQKRTTPLSSETDAVLTFLMEQIGVNPSIKLLDDRELQHQRLLGVHIRAGAKQILARCGTSSTIPSPMELVCQGSNDVVAIALSIVRPDMSNAIQQYMRGLSNENKGLTYSMNKPSTAPEKTGPLLLKALEEIQSVTDQVGLLNIITGTGEERKKLVKAKRHALVCAIHMQLMEYMLMYQAVKSGLDRYGNTDKLWFQHSCMRGRHKGLTQTVRFLLTCQTDNLNTTEALKKYQEAVQAVHHYFIGLNTYYNAETVEAPAATPAYMNESETSPTYDPSNSLQGMKTHIDYVLKKAMSNADLIKRKTCVVLFNVLEYMACDKALQLSPDTGRREMLPCDFELLPAVDNLAECALHNSFPIFSDRTCGLASYLWFQFKSMPLAMQLRTLLNWNKCLNLQRLFLALYIYCATTYGTGHESYPAEDPQDYDSPTINESESLFPDEQVTKSLGERQRSEWGRVGQAIRNSTRASRNLVPFDPYLGIDWSLLTGALSGSHNVEVEAQVDAAIAEKTIGANSSRVLKYTIEFEQFLELTLGNFYGNSFADELSDVLEGTVSQMKNKALNKLIRHAIPELALAESSINTFTNFVGFLGLDIESWPSIKALVDSAYSYTIKKNNSQCIGLDGKESNDAVNELICTFENWKENLLPAHIREADKGTYNRHVEQQRRLDLIVYLRGMRLRDNMDSMLHLVEKALPDNWQSRLSAMYNISDNIPQNFSTYFPRLSANLEGRSLSLPFLFSEQVEVMAKNPVRVLAAAVNKRRVHPSSELDASAATWLIDAETKLDQAGVSVNPRRYLRFNNPPSLLDSGSNFLSISALFFKSIINDQINVEGLTLAATPLLWQTFTVFVSLAALSTMPSQDVFGSVSSERPLLQFAPFPSGNSTFCSNRNNDNTARKLPGRREFNMPRETEARIQQNAQGNWVITYEGRDILLPLQMTSAYIIKALASMISAILQYGLIRTMSFFPEVSHVDVDTFLREMPLPFMEQVRKALLTAYALQHNSPLSNALLASYKLATMGCVNSDDSHTLQSAVMWISTGEYVGVTRDDNQKFRDAVDRLLCDSKCDIDRFVLPYSGEINASSSREVSLQLLSFRLWALNVRVREKSSYEAIGNNDVHVQLLKSAARHLRFFIQATYEAYHTFREASDGSAILSLFAEADDFDEECQKTLRQIKKEVETTYDQNADQINIQRMFAMSHAKVKEIAATWTTTVFVRLQAKNTYLTKAMIQQHILLYTIGLVVIREDFSELVEKTYTTAINQIDDYISGGSHDNRVKVEDGISCYINLSVQSLLSHVSSHKSASPVKAHYPEAQNDFSSAVVCMWDVDKAMGSSLADSTLFFVAWHVSTDVGHIEDRFTWMDNIGKQLLSKLEGGTTDKFTTTVLELLKRRPLALGAEVELFLHEELNQKLIHDRRIQAALHKNIFTVAASSLVPSQAREMPAPLVPWVWSAATGEEHTVQELLLVYACAILLLRHSRDIFWVARNWTKGRCTLPFAMEYICHDAVERFHRSQALGELVSQNATLQSMSKVLSGIMQWDTLQALHGTIKHIQHVEDSRPLILQLLIEKDVDQLGAVHIDTLKEQVSKITSKRLPAAAFAHQVFTVFSAIRTQDFEKVKKAVNGNIQEFERLAIETLRVDPQLSHDKEWRYLIGLNMHTRRVMFTLSVGQQIYYVAEAMYGLEITRVVLRTTTDVATNIVFMAGGLLTVLGRKMGVIRERRQGR